MKTEEEEKEKEKEKGEEKKKDDIAGFRAENRVSPIESRADIC